MAWVVDTCIVIDVLENDPEFGRASAVALEARMGEGLLVCPVTMVELAPAFDGDIAEQKRFLGLCGIGFSEPFSIADAETAHAGWNRYIRARRAGRTGKRPVADLLIGGFASRFDGLITRNGGDFRKWFPGLKVVQP